MNLTLKILNSDATLNNFVEGATASIVRGTDVKLILRIVQSERTNLRYIPQAASVLAMSLLNSDGTTLSVTPTQPFADDRSIIEVDIAAANTTLLISQNLNLSITEPTPSPMISFAVLPFGLQVISLNGDC